jgi:CheY-like chemotaxis protein
MKRWVLIIDDDRDNRELLAELLESASYGAVPCETAAEAEQVLSSRDDKPCLIISDIQLPDMNGRVFIEQTKRRAGFEDIAAIFVTGESPDRVGPTTERVLTKPFDLDVLMQLVAHHCDPKPGGAACES